MKYEQKVSWFKLQFTVVMPASAKLYVYTVCRYSTGNLNIPQSQKESLTLMQHMVLTQTGHYICNSSALLPTLLVSYKILLMDINNRHDSSPQ